MKEALCKEFCDQILVRTVPAGLAIGTSYEGQAGDPIGFYVVGPNANGDYRIEDSGTTVPLLEACGADVSLESRGVLFREMLRQYEVEYDEDRGELKTRAMREEDIPKSALRFVALLLRLQDLTFLTRERAESTFKEEVVRDVERELRSKAQITLDASLSAGLEDFKVDIVIRAPNRSPVAVFLIREAARMYEAMLFQVEAELKAKLECRVIALMESDSSVTKKVLNQAMNRVIPLRYRGEESVAIARIARESIGVVAVH